MLDIVLVGGGSTPNVANVDPNTFGIAVQPTNSNQYAGKFVQINEVDPGTYTNTGAAYRLASGVSADQRQFVGIDTALFEYGFISTAQDTNVWKFGATTMTAAQSGGFCQLNANATATTTTGCSMQTWKYFTVEMSAALRVSCTGELAGAIPANEVVEIGLFVATITTAPADGVWLQLTSAGVTGVINYNGIVTSTAFTAAGIAALIATNVNFEVGLVVSDDGCDFYLSGNYLGTVATPAGNAFPFLSGSLPVAFQQRNPGAVSGPVSYKAARVRVDQMDLDLAMPYAHQQAAAGLIGAQATQGATAGSSALYSNSLASGAGAAMTNTTAALGSGLGGQFAALPTLVVGTDGIVCSYQVPQGSVTQEARQYMCTGIRVQGAVTTVLAGGPVLYAYSVAFGHTAVSMATAEATTFASPTTKAPRRIPIGYETFAATAAVGTVGSSGGAFMPFATPIPVNPGEFIAVCAKNLGVVTTLGVVTLLVTFDGYWV